jgi:hypothetical protein
MSRFVSELPEKVTSMILLICRVSRGSVYVGSIKKVLYNKLSLFESELPEKDMSNVVVQCR